MNVSIRNQGDISVISLQGRILVDSENVEFINTIKASIMDGIKRIIVDLTDTEWMNSSGLGMLIAGRGLLLEVEGQMKLTGLNDSVSKVMHTSKLNLVFDIYPDLDSAVKSFR